MYQKTYSSLCMEATKFKGNDFRESPFFFVYLLRQVHTAVYFMRRPELNITGPPMMQEIGRRDLRIAFVDYTKV